MQSLQKCQSSSYAVAPRSLTPVLTRPWRCRIPSLPSAEFSKDRIDERDGSPLTGRANQLDPRVYPAQESAPLTRDPLYLFSCYLEWEKNEDPIAGWELLAAAQSSDSDTRASARGLLANSRHFSGMGPAPPSEFSSSRKRIETEDEMTAAPYGLEIIDDCTQCSATQPGFFCESSHSLLEQFNEVSHKSTLPAGAILFVEGQPPRGMFILCSGRVNLSTTSREGKILILKSAMPGEALGLSATVSGMTYEMTAETATPCHLSFIDRKHFLKLMDSHTEVGLHAAQCLSRDYRSAYRDIHDLILTRSSTGKLARLLLSNSSEEIDSDARLETLMTHEEMAQRIGASRETVTRLLSSLRRKRLIRLDGPHLIIRDRRGLEALAV